MRILKNVTVMCLLFCLGMAKAQVDIHLPEVAKGHYVVKMATKTDVIVRKMVVN